jgi:hypothetical protein
VQEYKKLGSQYLYERICLSRELCRSKHVCHIVDLSLISELVTLYKCVTCRTQLPRVSLKLTSANCGPWIAQHILSEQHWRGIKKMTFPVFVFLSNANSTVAKSSLQSRYQHFRAIGTQSSLSYIYIVDVISFFCPSKVLIPIYQTT